MSNPRIAEYGKATQIKKGEVRNKTGQPKKGISLVNAELKEKGYEPAKKQDIEATYMSLLQLEEEVLKELINDKSKPMLVRILVKNMLSGKGFDIIEKMLDRGIGKPVQAIDNTTSLKIEKELSKEEQDLINQALGQNI